MPSQYLLQVSVRLIRPEAWLWSLWREHFPLEKKCLIVECYKIPSGIKYNVHFLVFAFVLFCTPVRRIRVDASTTTDPWLPAAQHQCSCC